MNGSFFNRGLTKSATKLSSWLSHRFSSSPSSRKRSALVMSPNCIRVFLICESSCSAAVLQSGARWVGVGLGAGVGGEAGADGRSVWCSDEPIAPGLEGVRIGRGAAERESLLCLRACEGEANMEERIEDEEADVDAAMSVSESVCRPGAELLLSDGEK
jgi:hypothetical protein